MDLGPVKQPGKSVVVNSQGFRSMLQSKNLTASNSTKTSADSHKRKVENSGHKKKKPRLESQYQGKRSTEEKKQQKTGKEEKNVTLTKDEVKGGKKAGTIKKKRKKLYVLFIGNLPYDITEDEVREHFEETGGLTNVRLLTNRTTGKPRGCGYLEFKDQRSHKFGLRLHNSELKGRVINVEFTSPGRRSDKRLQKLKAKNRKLARFKVVREGTDHDAVN